MAKAGTDGIEITLDQLLDRYFSNPENCFVKTYEEDSNNNKECNCSTTETMLNGATATSNILYQQQIIQKQKNNIISLGDIRSILSEIPKKDIEE